MVIHLTINDADHSASLPATSCFVTNRKADNLRAHLRASFFHHVHRVLAYPIHRLLVCASTRLLMPFQCTDTFILLQRSIIIPVKLRYKNKIHIPQVFITILLIKGEPAIPDYDPSDRDINRPLPAPQFSFQLQMCQYIYFLYNRHFVIYHQPKVDDPHTSVRFRVPVLS